ncbi:MAG: hypothetical protein ACJKTH_03250 [Patescibacteria group bacterium UBA2163]
MIQKISLFLTLCLLVVTALPSTALAAQFEVGEQPSLPTGAIIDDVYMAGGNVHSAADITGDLVAGGGNVLIDGSISEDLITSGGSVTITGAVGDDLRVAGGAVTITGAIGGDVVAGTGQLHISGEGIGGDLVWGGGMLQLNAPVAGNVRLGGGEVIINAPIEGSVEFYGDTLILGSDASITGTLTYQSPNEVIMKDGAVVNGEISYEQTTPKDMVDVSTVATIFSVVTLIAFLMWLVAGLVIGLVFRRYTTTVVTHALTRPLASLGYGLSAAIVLPIISIILLFTIIGLPFAGLGLIAFAGLMLMGAILTPIALGSLLMKWTDRQPEYVVNWKSILLGVLVYMLLGFVPFIGGLVQLILTIMVIGGIVKLKLDIAKEW